MCFKGDLKMLEFFYRLQSIYKRLIEITDPKVFCEVLNELCLEIFINLKIIKIITKIQKQPSKKIKYLKELEIEANKELDNFYKEIKGLIEKDKINDPWILKQLNIYKNPSKYMTGPTDNKFVAMTMIQIALYDNIKTRQYRLAMKAPEKNTTISLNKIKKYEKFFPKTWNWLMQKSDFYKINEGLNNKAIKKLEDFYNCYNFNKPPKKLLQKNIDLFYKSRSTLMTGYIFGKQREYYDSVNEASLHFHPEEFKQYAGRALHAIEENMPVKENNKQIKKQQIIEYKTGTSELIMENKENIDFKKGEDPDKILSCYIKNNKKLPLFKIQNILIPEDYNDDPYPSLDKPLTEENIKLIKRKIRHINDQIQKIFRIKRLLKVVKDNSMSESKKNKKHHYFLEIKFPYKLVKA